ncbi:MAG: TIGR00366 family protein [Deltaproteobacteria bacterium]|nr:TIGR00366 family protein [Deltaproteobacteria bacterium]
MLQKLASTSTRWSTRWVPDAWVIAVILTIVAYFLGLFFTKSSAYQLIQHWGNGFWVLLSFGMQMCLIIMTGYILATTPIFSRLLNALAGLPKSPKGCIALMALVSMGLAWINWGLSIVGSAVFVRFMVKKQRGVDYRLLVATAYLGLGTFWHSGLSASAPLLVATPKHFLEKDIGIIPITETIFHPFNLLLALAVLVFMTIIGPLMHPKKGEEKEAVFRLTSRSESGRPEPCAAAVRQTADCPHPEHHAGLVGLPQSGKVQPQFPGTPEDRQERLPKAGQDPPPRHRRRRGNVPEDPPGV